jgi:uncharacterized glyoxalase superfamily protein PhnB
MSNEKSPAQVMPMIAVPSVDMTRDFYVEKLGFDHLMAVVGNDGQLDFCTVVRGGGRIMFTRLESSSVPEPSSQFYFQVEDVDSYHRQIVGTGLSPSDPQDMWWGDRVFIVDDNNSYKLWFYQSIGEPVPPVGMKIV